MFLWMTPLRTFVVVVQGTSAQLYHITSPPAGSYPASGPWLMNKGCQWFPLQMGNHREHEYQCGGVAVLGPDTSTCGTGRPDDAYQQSTRVEEDMEG